MKLFVVLRHGTSMDCKVEKEDVVEADLYLVKDGGLYFYRDSLSYPGISGVVATYAPAAWIMVKERKAEEAPR